MHGSLQTAPQWTRQPAGWSEFDTLSRADWSMALAAFSRHADAPPHQTAHRSGSGACPEQLRRLAKMACSQVAISDPEAFFKSNFNVLEVISRDGPGLLTGFFEPDEMASRERTDQFDCPIYAVPDDLTPITPENHPPVWDETFVFGRRREDGAISEYHDRAAIMAGALAGKGLEIAWVRDAITAFFIHVQGAARLRFADGSRLRVTYAGKSGHPFTPIGRYLVDLGEIAVDSVSMQSIISWLRQHPDRATDVMNRNRSFIFFREAGWGEDDDGPVAAAKVPLTPGYSIAVDRSIHTFATPVLVQADDVNGAPLQRLMIAQDTGSAITGAARGDMFFGSGHEAGRLAGGVKSPARFTILVPAQNGGGA